MRPALIVVVPPSLDDSSCLPDRLEPMHVQALVAQRPIKGLYVAVVRGFARTAEVDSDLVVIRPEVEHSSGEFAAVVHEQVLRLAP